MTTKRYLLTLSIVLCSFVPAVYGSYVAKYAAAGKRQTQVTGIDNTVYTLENLVDTTASHTVSGSGTAPSALFDGKFSGNNGRWYSNAGSKYVIFAFDAPTVVNAYAIYNGNSQYSNSSRAPKTWTLQGSSDNENWDDVDSQSDETEWAAGELRLYVFKNTTAYTYYKLNVTAQNGDQYVQIHELEFYNFASFSLASSGSVDITPSSFGAVFSLLCDDTAECTLRYGTSPDNLSSAVSLGALSKGVHTNAVTGLAFDTSYWWSVSASNGSETLESSTNAVRTSGVPVLGATTVTTDGNAATFFVSLEEAAMANTVGTTVTVAYGTSLDDLFETVHMGESSAATSFSQTVPDFVWGTTYYYAATATATVDGRLLSSSSSTNSFVVLWNGEIYVNAAAENATRPYNTPETAAKTIASALAVATDGATIHVEDGTYTISTPLSVSKGIRIIGNDEDPSCVIVRNTSDVAWNNKNHRCMAVNHAAALVSGITFEDGKNYFYGGNILIGDKGGAVSNCIIRAGMVRNDTAYGSNAALDGPGILSHCTIQGGYVGAESADSGKICSVYLGHASARIENCLVDGFAVPASNNKGGSGLLVENGTALNCTVVHTQYNVESADKMAKFAGIKVTGSGKAKYCVSALNTDLSGTQRSFLPGQSGSLLVNCAYDGIAGSLEPLSGMEKPVAGSAELFFNDYASGDYTPKKGGPLVNAGAEYEGMAATDLAGNRRKFGKGVDIGCYESQKTSGFFIVVR